MSKTSQRKLSMYQLGKADAKSDGWYGPRFYTPSKDYMRGWNGVVTRKEKLRKLRHYAVYGLWGTLLAVCLLLAASDVFAGTWDEWLPAPTEEVECG